jgi:hypothetical protein
MKILLLLQGDFVVRPVTNMIALTPVWAFVGM